MTNAQKFEEVFGVIPVMYVPCRVPNIDLEKIQEWLNKPYKEPEEKK